MTESIIENTQQINQICKRLLVEAGEKLDAYQLYVLQLMRWALLEKKHGLPWDSKVNETNVLCMVEKLIGVDHARVMQFLTQEPDYGDSYETSVNPEDLQYGVTPGEAARVLIENLDSRMPKGRVCVGRDHHANDRGLNTHTPGSDKPPRRHQHWSPDEDKRLLAGYSRDESVTSLAQQHERSRISIRARLIRLGRVDSYQKGNDYYGTYRPDLKGFERDRLTWTNHEQSLLVETYKEDSLTNISILAKIHRRHPLTIAYWLARLMLQHESSITIEDTDLDDDIRPFEVIDDFERTESKYLKLILEQFSPHPGLLSFTEAEEADTRGSLLYADANADEDIAIDEPTITFDEEPPLRSNADWSEVSDDLDSRDFEDYMGGPDDPEDDSRSQE